MILSDRRVQCVFERGIRKRLSIGQRGVELPGRSAKGFGIGARLGKRQIDQLEHRFQIAAERPAVQPFVHLFDVRTHDRCLPGELLVQINFAERTEPPFGHDPVSRLGGDVILITGERGAARAERAKEDFILFEGGRLENHANAV